jgi:hypothetical protein
MTGSTTVILPENLAVLPDKVADLEALTGVHETRLDGIDTAIAELELLPASSWESITDKPSSFPPATHSHSFGEITGLSETLGTWDLLLIGLTDRVDALEANPVDSGSSSFTVLTANTVLESNKSYFASIADLICVLPNAPTIGDFVDLVTGNYSLRINHGNASQQVLNSTTLSPVGSDNGIILKPYSSIRLVFTSANLWVSHNRNRIVNNWSNSPTFNSTSEKRDFTATTSATLEFGTTVDQIQNGIKQPNGSHVVSGVLSNAASVPLLITLASPTVLREIKVWSGQGNVPLNGASNYWTPQIQIYRGTTINDPLIGDFTFTNNTGIEQSKTVNDSIGSNQYLFVCSGAPIGLLELEIFGFALAQGEISI